ncbi:hypothetical protein [Streptomyces sp. NPDC093248]|uniref:hypothetical protein n=1 Tax=Streptomyces sp. NPDC093248 TaxID=3155072 RepID=UPI00343B393C
MKQKPGGIRYSPPGGQGHAGLGATRGGDGMRIPAKAPDDSRQWARGTDARCKNSPACLALCLLVLLLTTTVLGYFGVEDLESALNFPGRVTGAALIVAAVITFLGAAAVVDHWTWRNFPYSGPVALVATFVALLSNVLLLVGILKDGDSNLYLALFCVLTAGSLGAVFAVWRTSVVIPAPKRVAATLIVTSLIAVGNFGYQNLFMPSQREADPVIRLTTGTPVTSRDHKAFSIPVDITMENRSEVAFYVLGDIFHAMGQRVPLSHKDRLRQQWRTDSGQWPSFEGANPLSRREIHHPGQLVEAQPWMPYGRWIDPGGTFSARMVVQLPMNTPYDEVTFYASASLARKDRMSVRDLKFEGYSWRQGTNTPGWVSQHKQWDALVFSGEIHESNAIDEHTRDRRTLTVYWRFGQQGADIMEAVTAHGADANSAETQLRYGIRGVQTGPVERTLWDIKSRR